MVEESVQQGRRIAELLSSELSGRSDGELAAVSVVNADTDVEGSVAGDRAYDIDVDGAVVGSVFVHEQRARVTVQAGLEAAVAAVEETSLRWRLLEGESPRLLVFVESGAAVKRVIPVVRAVVGAVSDDSD